MQKIFLISKYASYFSGFILFLIMIATVIDITGRTFTDFIYVKGIHELTRLLLVVLVYFAFGSAEENNDHVEIDFLYDISIKKFPMKIQKYFYILRTFIYFSITVLMTWRVIVYGRYIMTTGSRTCSLRIPDWPFILISSLGLIMYSLVVLAKAINSIKDRSLK